MGKDSQTIKFTRVSTDVITRDAIDSQLDTIALKASIPYTFVV